MSQLNIPIQYYLIALAVFAILWLLTKKPAICLLIPYAFLVFAMTVLTRQQNPGMQYELHLFWSYHTWASLKYEIIANVIVFIPIGLLAGVRFRWKGILIGFGLSVMIEIIQLVSHRGLFELDDILHNTIGAAIGVVLFFCIQKVSGRLHKHQSVG